MNHAPRPSRLARRSLSAALVLTMALHGTGCASAYLKNRGRDACDMVTATVGCGAAVMLRVGPVPLGAVCVSDVAGLRHGQFFHQEADRMEPEDYDNRFAMVAMRAGTILISPFVILARGDPFLAVGKVWDFTSENWMSYARPSLTEIQRLRHKDKRGPSSASFWRVEACAGLGGTVRLGVNPAEILDFAVGLVGIDLFGDDIGHANALP